MEIVNKKREMIKVFLTFLFVFPFTVPVIFQDYLGFGNFVFYWKILSIILVLINSFTKKIKFSTQIWLLVIYLVYMGIITFFIYKNSIRVCLSQAITFFFLALLLGIAQKELFYRLLRILFTILLFESVINVISQYIYPDGIYYSGKHGNTISFVLGMENRFVFTYITCLVLGLVLKYIDVKYTKWFYIELAISIISLVKAWSVAAMCGIFILIVAVMLRKKIKEFVDGINASIIVILSNIGIVIFRIQEKILGIFGESFGKDIITLEGRTPIWDVSIDLLKKSPFLGYGWLSNDFASGLLLGFTHPHNECLYLLFQGGGNWFGLKYSNNNKMPSKIKNL